MICEWQGGTIASPQVIAEVVDLPTHCLYRQTCFKPYSRQPRIRHRVKYTFNPRLSALACPQSPQQEA